MSMVLQRAHSLLQIQWSLAILQIEWYWTCQCLYLKVLLIFILKFKKKKSAKCVHAEQQIKFRQFTYFKTHNSAISPNQKSFSFYLFYILQSCVSTVCESMVYLHHLVSLHWKPTLDFFSPEKADFLFIRFKGGRGTRGAWRVATFLSLSLLPAFPKAPFVYVDKSSGLITAGQGAGLVAEIRGRLASPCHCHRRCLPLA